MEKIKLISENLSSQTWPPSKSTIWNVFFLPNIFSFYMSTLSALPSSWDSWLHLMSTVLVKILRISKLPATRTQAAKNSVGGGAGLKEAVKTKTARVHLKKTTEICSKGCGSPPRPGPVARGGQEARSRNPSYRLQKAFSLRRKLPPGPRLNARGRTEMTFLH